MQTNSGPIPNNIPPPPRANELPPENKVISEMVLPRKHSRLIFLSIIILILLVNLFSAGSFYAFYIKPRVNTVKQLDEIYPLVSRFKLSAKGAKSQLDKIYFLTTEDIKTPTQQLETSKIKEKDKLAEVKNNQAVLGTQTDTASLSVENTVKKFAYDISQYLSTNNSNVKGISKTSEDEITNQTRMIKEETIKAVDYIQKAKTDLAALVSRSSASAKSVDRETYTKISQSYKMSDKIDPYLNEGLKVTNYLSALCDVLIEMNTKINSFMVAIMSFSSSMDTGGNNQNFLVQAQGRLTFAQTFLDQAKKDTDDINRLINKMENMPQDALPQGSEKYHEHNIKTLSTVTSFFSSISTVLQRLTSATNILVAKTQNQTLTKEDLQTYLLLSNALTNAQNTASAKFVSDIQSLSGEEKSLTISFWQNNTLLASGANIESEIDAYGKTLSDLRENKQVPYFTKK